MNDAVIVAVVTLFAAPFAAAITWLFNRKKNVADIYSVLTDSSQSVVETMKITMDTLHDELQSTQARVEILSSHIAELEIQILKLKIELSNSEKENASLRERIYLLTATLQARVVEENKDE